MTEDSKKTRAVWNDYMTLETQKAHKEQRRLHAVYKKKPTEELHQKLRIAQSAHRRLKRRDIFHEKESTLNTEKAAAESSKQSDQATTSEMTDTGDSGVKIRKLSKSEAPKDKFFRCELCNIRQHLTPKKYDEHIKSNEHRHTQLLFDYGMWPGQADYVQKHETMMRKLTEEQQESLQQFQTDKDVKIWQRYVTLSKQIVEVKQLADSHANDVPKWLYAFYEKNDGQVYCHACRLLLNDATNLLIHQMTERHITRVKLMPQAHEKGFKTLYYCESCNAFIGHSPIPYYAHLKSDLHCQCLNGCTFDWASNTLIPVTDISNRTCGTFAISRMPF